MGFTLPYGPHFSSSGLRSTMYSPPKAFVARLLNRRNHAPTGPYASLKRTGTNRTSCEVSSAPALRVKYVELPAFHGGYQARPMPSPIERGLNTWTAPPRVSSVAFALN